MSSPFVNFFDLSHLHLRWTVQLLLLLVPLLVWLLVMENGERLVHRRRCTVCLCLANLNKEGIVLHYHLRGLVSTQKLSPWSARPKFFLSMENVRWSDRNGQWRIARAPAPQQRQHLLPVHEPGPGGNGDQRWNFVHGMRTTDNGA